MSRGRAAALALAALALAGEARADRPPPPVRHVEVVDAPRTEGDGTEPEQQRQPFLSLRLMPMQLIAGIGQVGAELMIVDKLSLLAHAGAGRVNVVDLASGAKVRKTLFDVDLQGRYYPVGDISGGIYGGLGANFTRVDSDQLISSPLMNIASGLHVMPSFGANYTSPWRVSVDLQFILAYRLHEPTPSERTPEGVGLRASDLRIGAALALGYLF